MKGEREFFRKKAFGGFNREDVIKYIAKIANERNEALTARDKAQKDAKVLADEIKQLREQIDKLSAEKIIPVIEEEQPVIEEEQPVIEEEQPVIEEEQPAIEEEQPVIEEEPISEIQEAAEEETAQNPEVPKNTITRIKIKRRI